MSCLHVAGPAPIMQSMPKAPVAITADESRQTTCVASRLNYAMKARRWTQSKPVPRDSPWIARLFHANLRVPFSQPRRVLSYQMALRGHQLGNDSRKRDTN